MKRFWLMLLSGLLVLAVSGCSSTKNIVTAEEQGLNMSTILNARELGGYKTRDGKSIRKGMLFRTAALTDASQEELDALMPWAPEVQKN